MAQPSPMDATEPGVSKLAAKVAHELNNPLDAVLRYVSLAQRKARSGQYSDIERYLADAQFGLQRMAEVLRELMDIGRQTNEILTGGGRPNLIPLTDLVAGAIRTAAAQAEQKRVALVVRNLLPDDATPAYDLRLSQVLANLLKNAVEASPEESPVRVTLSLDVQKVAIRIEDSGAGLPEELLPNLFVPFVTTKPPGTGHGLGLAISRELVMSLDGALTLANRDRAGCVATVLLPLRNQ